MSTSYVKGSLDAQTLIKGYPIRYQCVETVKELNGGTCGMMKWAENGIAIL